MEEGGVNLLGQMMDRQTDATCSGCCTEMPGKKKKPKTNNQTNKAQPEPLQQNGCSEVTGHLLISSASSGCERGPGGGEAAG